MESLPTPAHRFEITKQDFHRLYPQLRSQIVGLGVPVDEAEDLIQETFLHAQRALEVGRFEGRSALDTWIISIAKKRTLKWFCRRRAVKRRAPLVPLESSDETERGPATTLATSEPDPQASAFDRERLVRALAAIEELPEDFRAPLVLSVRGHTYEQIAGCLKIPVSTVTSRIHQARAKLRRSLSAREAVPSSSG